MLWTLYIFYCTFFKGTVIHYIMSLAVLCARLLWLYQQLYFYLSYRVCGQIQVLWCSHHSRLGETLVVPEENLLPDCRTQLVWNPNHLYDPAQQWSPGRSTNTHTHTNMGIFYALINIILMLLLVLSIVIMKHISKQSSPMLYEVYLGNNMNWWEKSHTYTQTHTLNLITMCTSKIILFSTATALDMIVANGQQSAVMHQPFNQQNPA